MRDTSKDMDVVTDVWRWIHNNIPGEPSTDDGPKAVIIRLLQEGEEAKRRLRERKR